MRRNLAILAILTLLIFYSQAEEHDWHQEEWHMNDWKDMNNMDPNHMEHMGHGNMGNMQTHYNMGEEMQHRNNGNNRDEDEDDEDFYNDDDNEETFGILYFFIFIVLAGINIYLCIKCLRKRQERKGIEEQMRLKRISFATLHGFDILTLNDPRHSNTIHV